MPTPACVGLITWMHTFSPAKMWIPGLPRCRNPSSTCTRSSTARSPGPTIDMDFMNLNQAAHGDREFGFLAARMRLERKVVVGHWREPRSRTGSACGRARPRAWHDWAGRRIARFGDNMREVAVTEGDKVEAQRRLGFSVNTLRRGRPGRARRWTPDAEVDDLVETISTSTTSRQRSDRAGTRRRRCATARGSSSASEPSSTRRVLHGVHRRRSRTSWPDPAARPRGPAAHGAMGTASAPKATGRRPRWSGR